MDQPPSWVSASALPSLRLAGGRTMAGDAAVEVACHDDWIPPYAESALDRLYGQMFSSLGCFRVYGGAERASTYVERRGERITGLLLYRRAGPQVRVINESIRVDDGVAGRFARTMFARYPDVNVVRFNAVDTNIRAPGFPHQLYGVTDDTIIPLPDSADAYFEMLGKNTRKNLKRHLRRLQESFPDFECRIAERDAIREEDIRAVIGLNRARRQRKNKASGFDGDETGRMIRLARTHGLLSAIRINGSLCAGALVFRFGDNCYSYVRAHDPRYDDFRLGLVGGFLLVSACIARGGREFHMMWGREPHKQLLGGIQTELNHLALYRSLPHMLRHADIALGNLRTAQARRLRLWVQAQRERDTALWRGMHGAARLLRRARG